MTIDSSTQSLFSTSRLHIDLARSEPRLAHGLNLDAQHDRSTVVARARVASPLSSSSIRHRHRRE